MEETVKNFDDKLNKVKTLEEEKNYILGLVDLNSRSEVKVPYQLLMHCSMMQKDSDIIEIFADAQADVINTIKKHSIPIKNHDIDILILGMYLGMFYYAYDGRFF